MPKQRSDKELAISQHRAMWKWIAGKPGRTKADFEHAHAVPEDFEGQCYLCTYANREMYLYAERMLNTTFPHYCSYCPLSWGGQQTAKVSSLCCRRFSTNNKVLSKGLYIKWSRAMNSKLFHLARYYATLIRDLNLG